MEKFYLVTIHCYGEGFVFENQFLFDNYDSAEAKFNLLKEEERAGALEVGDCEEEGDGYYETWREGCYDQCHYILRLRSIEVESAA